MSEFDKINQKVAAQKAVRRKEMLFKMAYLLATLLVVVLVVVGLEFIGFISKLFMAILVAGAICVGSFNAGRIWNGYER